VPLLENVRSNLDDVADEALYRVAPVVELGRDTLDGQMLEPARRRPSFRRLSLC
jgi:hypothetical protein